MPNCFQLRLKGDKEPVTFISLDEKLCGMLGVDVHPDKYVASWYDAIGFMIAIGKPLGSKELRDIVAEYEDDRLTRILVYLEEHYKSTAWAESSSRKSSG